MTHQTNLKLNRPKPQIQWEIAQWTFLSEPTSLYVRRHRQNVLWQIAEESLARHQHQLGDLTTGETLTNILYTTDNMSVWSSAIQSMAMLSNTKFCRQDYCWSSTNFRQV